MLCLVAPAPGRATERAYRLNQGPWTLERFGEDVAVLRSGSSTSSPDGVGLLVACSGRDRSLRLTFPGAFAPLAPGHTEGGQALMTPDAPPRSRQGLVTRFKVIGGKTLVVTTDQAANRDPVSRLATLLAGRPHALDILVSWGTGPVVLTRLDVFRIAMQGDAPDRGLADQFLAACGRPEARQAD